MSPKNKAFKRKTKTKQSGNGSKKKIRSKRPDPGKKRMARLSRRR